MTRRPVAATTTDGDVMLFFGNIQITDDDLDLLETVAAADGEFGSVYIYSTLMRNTLVAHGLIRVDATGWAHGTDSLRRLLPSVQKAMGVERC